MYYLPPQILYASITTSTYKIACTKESTEKVYAPTLQITGYPQSYPTNYWDWIRVYNTDGSYITITDYSEEFEVNPGCKVSFHHKEGGQDYSSWDIPYYYDDMSNWIAIGYNINAFNITVPQDAVDSATIYFSKQGNNDWFIGLTSGWIRDVIPRAGI